MRVRHRLALVAAGTLLLATSAAVIATRRSAVEQHLRRVLAEALAAPCTFERAEFGVLDGLRVHDLRVHDPDDPFGPPLVSVGDVRVDYHLGLLGGGPRITSVILHGPRVRLRVGPDGTPALARVLRTRAEPGAPPAALPTIRIFAGTLEIEGAPLLAAGRRVELRGIQADVVAADGVIRVPRASATGTAVRGLTVSASSREEGRLLEVSARLEGVDVTALRAAGIAAAAARVLEAHDVTGGFDAEGTLRIEDGRIVDARGSADLRDVSLLFTVPESADTAPPEPLRVRIDGVRAELSRGTVTLRGLAGEVLGAPLAAQGEIHVPDAPGAPPGTVAHVRVQALLQGVPLGPATVPHLHAGLRRIQAAFDLSGTADVRLDVDGPPATARVDAHLDVRDAAASYVGETDPVTGARTGFPWRITDVAGTVDVAGSRVTFEAAGRHGDAAVQVSGLVDDGPEGFPLTDVRVTGTDVPIDDDLRAGFRERAEAVLGRWQPAGTAARIEVRVEQDPVVDRGGTATQVVVTLDGRARFVPDVLPVPLEQVAGVVRILEPAEGGARGARVEIDGVSARGEGFTLTRVEGVVADDPSGVRDERLSVTAEVERLEGPFRTGLLGSVTVPDTVKRAVRLLEPRGAAGLDVVLRDRDGERDDRVGVTLRGASVAGWEGVPLAAEDVRGRVDYAADALTCRDVALRVLGAPVRIAEGRLEGLSGAAPRATLDVAARGLPLDRRLRAALGVLADDAAGVWDELDPEPDLRGDVHASVRPPGGAGPPLELRFDALSGGLRVLGLRIVLDEGEARFDGGSVAGSAAGRLGEGDFRAGAFHLDTRSGDARVDLDARSLEFARDLVPLVTEETAASVTSTLRPTLLHVVGARLAWDAAARRLTASGTASLRPAERDVHADDGGHAVEGTVAFDGLTVDLPVGGGVRAQGAVRISETALAVGVDVEDLEGRATVVYDSGEEAGLYATVDEASARLAGFPLEALSFRLHAAGERLRVDDVTAQVHGGRLAGRFQRGGERLAYRGAFTVESLDLALAGGDPGAERAGHVDLDVRFRNPSGEPGALEGAGTARVSEAGVRVPFLTAALEALDGALLGTVAIEGGFREGHAAFDLRGSRVLVRELELAGPRMPLLFDAELDLRDGRGALDLASQRLDLVVYPRVRFAALDIDPTGIVDRVFGLAQLAFRRLRIEGTLRNPRTSWEVISRELEEEFRPRPLPVGEIRPYGAPPW